MRDQKHIIRKEILRAREALSSAEIERKSTAIIRRLAATKEFLKSGLVMCYMDFRNEVRTAELIKECLAAGKRTAFPLVLDTEGSRREMAAYEVRDVEREMEPGTWGILEPKRNVAREVSPEEIDLVVVPGVVFDLRRYRIGYGAGYYDRFLRRARKDCFKIGIAFELQIVDRVPVEEHDMQLDMIITEDRII